MNRFLHHLAFATGLLAIAWVGSGYVPGSPLALALVLLIGAFYLMGAVELHRFHRDTTGLVSAVAATDPPPAALQAWVDTVPASVRQAVRLRVEGERVGLPGPALTPYLAGLLVLLGMLGTFLGMVVTLQGTGLALEQATDVDAIRASLAAPVKGLGLAFGTSVAGVAASAMLGLMSALSRRERQRAVQALDGRIATTLRGFSQARQREESLGLLRAQADAMPAVVAQLQALVAHLERQGEALHGGLVDGQARFHGEAREAYTALAESVDRSLKASLSESARLAGAAIEPAVQGALRGLAREATALRDGLSGVVQQQVDAVTARLDATGAQLAERWEAAFADQQRHAGALTRDMHAALERVAGGFAQRADALVDGVASRLDRSADAWSASLQAAITDQRHGHAELAAHARDAQAAMVARFGDQAEALLQGVSAAREAADRAAAEREQARMTEFHDGLAALTTALHRQAEADGEALAERQQQICSTLERTAQAITAQAQAQARETLGEIARLVDAAAEAPRAAAEVIGELRTVLSDSLARDNAALDERNRLMATLGSLLEAVSHASTSQRDAIDALVQGTTAVLDRAGSRFAEQVDAESRTLQAAAVQVAGGAAEVHRLGDGFGAAVQAFTEASGQLMGQLGRIESALGHSLARSDEQLAYYVAQAREIVDLTLGSQKQLFEDLQRLPRPAAEAAAA